MSTTTPRWVARLRSSCPRGWSVKESRGSIRLSVRAGAGGASGASVTLPLAWAADEVDAAITLITDLRQMVDAGHDLRDALQRVNGAALVAKPSSLSQWSPLLERFHEDLKLTNQIKPTTWKDSYEPFLSRAVDLMSAAGSPVNARELVSATLEPWSTKPRSRELCVNAIRRFLEFGVEVCGLPAESWTLTDRAAKQLKGRKAPRREVATLTDPEILRLLESLPETEACDRWRNAIKLMALYGLRPEELKHLVVVEHSDTKQPALKCTYLKAAQKSGKPRWLMPLPLSTSTGEVVEWNLAGAMAIGQLPLPALSDKFAVRTFLERQPFWKELKEKYAGAGEWVRAYSFRNSYALRAHQAGHRLNTICSAMGHSPAVHQSSYEWAKEGSVLEFAD